MSLKGKVYEKLPLKVKIELEINRQIRNNEQRELKFVNERARVYVIGESDNGNVGDLAITVEHTKIIKSIVKSEMQVIKILYSDFWKYYSFLKRNIRKCDLITIPGGGNIGNVYIEAEMIRQVVIHEFKNNEIIVFPSTIYYLNKKNNNELYKRSLSIYNAHNDLTIYAREKYSYYTLKELYKKNNIILMPDMVFRYKYQHTQINRKEKILLCLRHDSEGILEEKEKKYIYSECIKRTNNVLYTDTFIKNIYANTDDSRIDIINAKLDEFAEAKLIITDRLHGMVLAYLANTPCIVLNNYNYKIKGVYEWISACDNVIFVKDINEIGIYIERLYGKDTYRENIKMDYKSLEKQLLQWRIENEEV